MNPLTVHIKSILRGKWDKGRIVNAFVLFRMREGRGSGFIGQFWDYVNKGGTVAVISLALGVKLPWEFYAMFGIGYIIVAYLVGYVDETNVKIWQHENEMNTTYINPYYQRLEKKIDELDRKVSEWDRNKEKERKRA